MWGLHGWRSAYRRFATFPLPYFGRRPELVPLAARYPRLPHGARQKVPREVQRAIIHGLHNNIGGYPMWCGVTLKSIVRTVQKKTLNGTEMNGVLGTLDQKIHGNQRCRSTLSWLNQRIRESELIVV